MISIVSGDLELVGEESVEGEESSIGPILTYMREQNRVKAKRIKFTTRLQLIGNSELSSTNSKPED